jgi:hypothetical protein
MLHGVALLVTVPTTLSQAPRNHPQCHGKPATCVSTSRLGCPGRSNGTVPRQGQAPARELEKKRVTVHPRPKALRKRGLALTSRFLLASNRIYHHLSPLYRPDGAHTFLAPLASPQVKKTRPQSQGCRDKAHSTSNEK